MNHSCIARCARRPANACIVCIAPKSDVCSVIVSFQHANTHHHIVPFFPIYASYASYSSPYCRLQLLLPPEWSRTVKMILLLNPLADTTYTIYAPLGIRLSSMLSNFVCHEKWRTVCFDVCYSYQRCCDAYTCRFEPICRSVVSLSQSCAAVPTEKRQTNWLLMSIA